MLARQLDQVICVLNLAREQPPNLGIPVLARLDAELGGDVARDAGGDGGVNEDFLSAGGCARGRGDDGVVADEGGADGFDRGDVDALDGYRGGEGGGGFVAGNGGDGEVGGEEGFGYFGAETTGGLGGLVRVGEEGGLRRGGTYSYDCDFLDGHGGERSQR